MADYIAEARRAATRVGLDPNIFVRQIRAESQFNPTIRSPAGAIGIAQIMPDTARSWGVNPLDPIASLRAAATNMASYVKKYGSYENALRAYNAGPGAIQRSHGYAETNAYVSKILNGREPGGLSTGTNRASTQPSTPADPVNSALQVLASPAANFTLPERPKVQATNPEAPAFTAKAAMAGAQIPAAATRQAPARVDANGALAAIGSLQVSQAQQAQTLPQADPSAAPASSGNGKFKISGPSPDRLKPHLVSFANRVADQLGMTLTGLDGSSHSKYTTNGNVSQHYTGNATDIFTINGKSLKQNPQLLIQAGRAALIAAGMDPAKARKAGIGLYNVGGHQIIFGTNSKALGGDHTDHLHISAR